jgi:hypothetical protein
MSETEIEQVHEPITDLAQLGEQADISFVPDQAIQQAESVMTATSFLPRIQVNGSSTELVKMGKLPMGTFGLVWSKEKFVDLGKEAVMMVISVRSKALLIPQQGEQGNPVSYYDPQSEDFQRVQAKALVKNQGMTGAMFGPEFLVWLPNQQTFATFFHSSETSRRIAPSIIQLMRKDKDKPSSGLRPAAIRAKTKFIDPPKASFSWWGHEILPETSPLPAPPEGFGENLRRELEKFNNPPAVEVEVAPQPAAAAGRAR